MSRFGRRPRWCAVFAAAAMVVAPLAAATPARADDQVITVDIPSPRPTLRWGINPESTSGAYVGGCNFLMAGKAPNRGSSTVWAEADAQYRASDGAVRIEKPTSAGGWEVARWDTRCLDRSGTPVHTRSVTSNTGSQIVIDDGELVRGADGSTTISWRGSFTVVFYGGLTYWSASDPVLRIEANGRAALTATLSGYGTTRDDMSVWRELEPAVVDLATFASFPLGTTGGSATPDYLGVAATGPQVSQSARSERNSAYWGAFPASFLAYQQLTGQSAYWYTSGGARDGAKPPLPVTVSFGGAAPAPIPPAPIPSPPGDPDDGPSAPPIPSPRPTAAPSAAGVAAGGADGAGGRGAGVPRRAGATQAGVVPGSIGAPLALAPGAAPLAQWRDEPLIPRDAALAATGGDPGWTWWAAAGLLAAAAGVLLAGARRASRLTASGPRAVPTATKSATSPAATSTPPAATRIRAAARESRTGTTTPREEQS